MIETVFLLLGLGFSLLVHLRTIRTSPYSPLRRTIYSLLSAIGITGMVWLSGVLIAHALRERGLL